MEKILGLNNIIFTLIYCWEKLKIMEELQEEFY